MAILVMIGAPTQSPRWPRAFFPDPKHDKGIGAPHELYGLPNMEYVCSIHIYIYIYIHRYTHRYIYIYVYICMHSEQQSWFWVASFRKVEPSTWPARPRCATLCSSLGLSVRG